MCKLNKFNIMKNNNLFLDVVEWAKRPHIKPSNICLGQFNKQMRVKANFREKVWGNMINRKLFNKNNNTVNWTTTLGEQLVKNTLEYNGENVFKPTPIKGYKPDWETNDFIYEVKTRNWTTSGTAGEKVLGVPYKYSDIPRLYGKPLRIICVAYQEYEFIYGNTKIFGNISTEKQKLLDTFKQLDITFVKFTDLI